MNRLLVVGALVVLAGGIFLWLAMREDNAAKGASPSASPTEDTKKKDRQANRDRPATPDQPSGGVTVRDVPSQPREYTVDGVRIRDHRKGSHAPVDLPPNIHPPDTRRIASTVTHGVITQMTGVVKECAAGLPADARGAKPRVEGTVFLGIKDKQARTNEAKVQLRDVVAGAWIDTIKSCIESKSIGLTTAADEADLERYSITVSFAL
jgi:hypothetical protein